MRELAGKTLAPNMSSQALADRVVEIRNSMSVLPPEVLADRTGAEYLLSEDGIGEFHLPYFGKMIRVDATSPSVYQSDDRELPAIHQALVAYYFATATGVQLANNWVSFSGLPNGRIYAGAFQGYTGDLVAGRVGLNLQSFHEACKKAGGLLYEMADAAYLFIAFPKFPMLLAYWLGDDEFPSTCKVLFDAAACEYLPIDGCAIAGTVLVKKILNS